MALPTKGTNELRNNRGGDTLTRARSCFEPLKRKIVRSSWILFFLALFAYRALHKPDNLGRRSAEGTSEPSPSALPEGAQAISIETSDPPRKFEIMIFSPKKDKHISGKLMQRPITYERDDTQFVHTILKPPQDNNLRAAAATTTSDVPPYWAVDLGANIGFHALHMASLGTAKIIALEPAPDTHALLSSSVQLNADFDKRLTVFNVGAADTAQETAGMHRHPGSPGMTTLAQVEGLPSNWQMEQVGGNKDGAQKQQQKQTKTERRENDASSSGPSSIRLVPVEQLLDEAQLPQAGKVHNVPNSPSRLRLLKVDVEGFEMLALRGLNLTKYPFEYVLMEYFPQLLRAASKSGAVPMEHPSEVLEYLMVEHGYMCVNEWTDAMTDDSIFKDSSKLIGNTKEQVRKFAQFYEGKHTNVYCKSNKTPLGTTP